MWVHGALRAQDGHELTLTARSRNAVGYLELLNAIDAANSEGELFLITDNLSSHTSQPVREWLATIRASIRSSSRRAPVG